MKIVSKMADRPNDSAFDGVSGGFLALAGGGLMLLLSAFGAMVMA